MSRDTRWRHQSKTLHIYVVCTSIIVCTNFEAITENFATDISWKFIFDIFKPAARGRSNIAWRHRLHFWKALPCRTLTPLKAIQNISPISNCEPLPVSTGRKGHVILRARTKIKTHINSISSHKKQDKGTDGWFYTDFLRLKKRKFDCL